jgi:HD-GYP domain-containing protein (c-di-GMP phosphodiesterase class II)
LPSLPYRPAYSREEAFHRLAEMAGTKLDRDVVEALLAVESWQCVRAA